MEYKFSWTPIEAQAAAIATANYFSSKGYRIRIEPAVASNGEEAPYRPTLSATLGELVILVEAQGSPNYTPELTVLARWTSARRFYGKLFVATAVTAESRLSMRSLNEMQRDGVGLLLVEDDGTVRVSSEARNPRLIVSLPPDMKYGARKQEVREILEDYNAGGRLAACRNIAEAVEGEIRRLALKASRKGWLDRSEATIESMDQSNRIDVLAAPSAYKAGRTPLVDANLKNDLQSFRGARNIFDHPARSRREEQRREQQFPERIVSGARLISELVRLERKCK